MKKIFVTVFILPLILLSCSETIYEADQQMNETRAVLSKSEPYSFQKIIEPSNWKRYTSLHEMLAALQMPEEARTAISTEDLVSTCLNYPLYLNYTAYNNELVGIKNVQQGFNGFEELKNRDDAAEKIIEAYSGLSLYSPKSSKELSIPNLLRIDYMELILASECIPSVFDKEHVGKLLDAFNRHYKDKADNQKTVGYYSLKKSLLLGCVIVKNVSSALTETELESLNNYILNGGEVESVKDAEEIIRILYKQ